MAVSLETLAVTRLAACARVMDGVQHAWEVPPGGSLLDEDLPGAYALVGATQPGRTAQARAQYTLVRRFTHRFVVARLTSGADELQAGSEAQQRALPLFSTVWQYWWTHPRLQVQGATDGTEQPLRYLLGFDGEDALQDSGIYARKLSGVEYAVIDFTYDLIFRHKPG